MSVWLAASIVMCAGLAPSALGCLRCDIGAALAALNVVSTVTVLILVTRTVAFAGQAFVDLAVVLAPMSLGGSLAFARYMERQQER